MRNTISLSVRLPDKLLAELAEYLINVKKLKIASKSELIRESLWLLREVIKNNSENFREIPTTDEARSVNEHFFGPMDVNKRNKKSFLMEIGEELGYGINLNDKDPLSKSRNSGAQKNYISPTKELSEEELLKHAFNVMNEINKPKQQLLHEAELKETEFQKQKKLLAFVPENVLNNVIKED